MTDKCPPSECTNNSNTPKQHPPSPAEDIRLHNEAILLKGHALSPIFTTLVSDMNVSVLNADINVSEVFHPLTPDNSSSRGLRLDYRSLITSATMFAVGVLGNLVAIVVLCISKKEQKETTFYSLVCGMAVTDLLGTCFTSPVVIATYIVGRWPGGALLCHLFSFSMLFFGSAGMSILCTMSVERYLAINHAYFYSKHVDRTMARFALLVAYSANIVLCAMPSFGFGKHVKHFPGTWCFLDWRALDALGASYSFLYAGFMLVLIAVTVVCNFAVCRSLVSMSKKARVIRAETPGHAGSRRVFSKLPSVTSAAEIQMFWLLIFMTIVFLICSIPLVMNICAIMKNVPTAIGRRELTAPLLKPDKMSCQYASRRECRHTIGGECKITGSVHYTDATADTPQLHVHSYSHHTHVPQH
ncbi:hypothetical protein P4O66_014566 [Electrophorus voltai]|uniref:G-protein coupled receptors family 1 profile domain-containing protein n=1 Tax=Electrophorus voltai TaxID=2609070 RepID=A0AAD8Z150_9TELE|nr:hypothetical protein P4O66_014566 [Electrophorus voltai]